MIHRTPGSGFTLIELVLVAAVLGLLLLASIPRFQQTAQRLRLERSAFELTQLLRYAHARAAAEGIELIWVWDEKDRQAHLERLLENGQSARLEERAASSAPLMGEASVSLIQAGEPVACECVRFFPDGTSEATTLTVSLRESLYRITIDEATSQVLLAAGVPAR